ncbi:hypothetical protein RFI_26380 [Reticulomyxa filosa]|uniref:Endonuclease/exonuclease/phosphatase domain-containing protein n=1 Tax=Reticulomyxa filosa TaxID=46433 RepID=X6MBF8_RETFI|nr:hypothetical protein RFI_26380 [Reticulomyxa filosa]|eukprot:ETO10996.1 hypothetical protein RFI_26380 [Reticulomyxa filosa]
MKGLLKPLFQPPSLLSLFLLLCVFGIMEVLVLEHYVTYNQHLCPTLSSASMVSSSRATVDAQDKTKKISVEEYEAAHNKFNKQTKEYLTNKLRVTSASIKELVNQIKLDSMETFKRSHSANRQRTASYLPQPKPYKSCIDLQSSEPNPRSCSNNKDTFIIGLWCHRQEREKNKRRREFMLQKNWIKFTYFVILYVCTYNLWQIQEPVEQRMKAIGQVIEEYDMDIIAFQEIRHIGNNRNNKLQMDMIVEHLNKKDGNSKPWHYVLSPLKFKETNEVEYLGILTKFDVEIVKHSQKNLQSGNKERIIMITTLYFKTIDLLVNVWNVHLGLDALGHCMDAIDIWNWSNDQYSANHASNFVQIILGDFNTYFDFEFPLELLTFTPAHKLELKFFLSQKKYNPCFQVFQRYFAQLALSNLSYPHFIDGLLRKYERINTRLDVCETFTNFKDFRIIDPTRADRLLFRSPENIWDVCDAWVIGHQPIGTDADDLVIFPSDHKGVVVKMFKK